MINLEEAFMDFELPEFDEKSRFDLNNDLEELITRLDDEKNGNSEEDKVIIDPSEEDLKDNYIGKILIECDVCRSKFVVDSDKVSEFLGSPCEICGFNDSMEIIGSIVKYSEVSKREKEEILEKQEASDNIEEITGEDTLNPDEVEIDELQSEPVADLKIKDESTSEPDLFEEEIMNSVVKGLKKEGEQIISEQSILDDEEKESRKEIRSKIDNIQNMLDELSDAVDVDLSDVELPDEHLPKDEALKFIEK